MSKQRLGKRDCLGLAVLFVLFASALGCPPKTPTEAEILRLELSVVRTLTVNQGAAEDATITITRTNFTGAVALSTTGLPAGVSVVFSDNPVTGNTSEMTVTVAATVPVGSYDFGVIGEALGAQPGGVLAIHEIGMNLIVEEASPGFRLEDLDPLTVQQGSSGVRTVTITRFGGFAGDVSVTVTNLTGGAGMTASVDPVTTGGSSVEVTIEVASTVPVGSYVGTVRGNAAGQPEDTEGLDIIVTAAGQQVSLDFSACVADQRPDWFAYQDGAGPWTRVVPALEPHVYTFGIASETAAIAVHTAQGGGSNVLVVHATRSEMVSADLGELCDVIATGKTVTAGVTGIQTGVEGATITLGDAVVEAVSGGLVTFTSVPDGNLDLVAYRWSFSVSERMLFRRDLDPANNSDIGAIDFFGADAFDPVFANITMQGGSGSSLHWFTEYATSPAAGACYYAPLDDDTSIGSTFIVGGAPAAQQQAGDFHVVTVTDGTYTVSETFATLANRTISFGQSLPAPAITDITGGAFYRRVRAELTLLAEYDSNATLSVSDNTGDHRFSVIATSAWLGGLTVSVEIPDFTGEPGWVDVWAPPSSSASSWVFSASGWTGDDCTEGAREVTAIMTGTVG